MISESCFWYVIWLFSECVYGHLRDLGEVVSPRKGFAAKIIGGVPVTIEKYPFEAQFFNNGAMCAASVLGSKVFLTAAHCFDYNRDKEEMQVHVGAKYIGDAKNSQSHNVWDYTIHDDYNRAVQFSCDIALIFIEGVLIFGPKVKKAVLVDSIRWMRDGEENFEALGWGLTKYGGSVSRGLLQTYLRYVPLERCKELHNQYLSNDMFCLYGDGERDSCTGDSGGGILWNGMLVGIVSHGDGCGQKDKPSVYANVFMFRDWIRNEWQHFTRKHCNTQYDDTMRTLLNSGFDVII